MSTLEVSMFSVLRSPRLSRREVLRQIGLAAAMPLIVRAQNGPVSPPTVVSTPPRDFGQPSVYFSDPDVLTIDASFGAVSQGNAPIERLWTGGLWLEGP